MRTSTKTRRLLSLNVIEVVVTPLSRSIPGRDRCCFCAEGTVLINPPTLIHDDKVMFLLINTKGWLVFYSFIGQRSHAGNEPVKSARRGIDREKNIFFDRYILRNVMGRSKNGVDHEKLRRIEKRACFLARDDFFLC